MGKLGDYLFAWAPLAVVIVVWIMLRPRFGGQMTESIERARECVDLQKRILSCLEDIKTELKAIKEK
jgi:hypothetical protein